MLHVAIMGVLHFDVKEALQMEHHMADVDRRSKDGLSPLDISALRVDTEVVKVLIQASADVNSKDTTRGGGTPLSAACTREKYEIDKLLPGVGVSVAERDGKGYTAPGGMYGVCV